MFSVYGQPNVQEELLQPIRRDLPSHSSSILYGRYSVRTLWFFACAICYGHGDRSRRQDAVRVFNSLSSSLIFTAIPGVDRSPVDNLLSRLRS
jgi:hypothetical protein